MIQSNIEYTRVTRFPPMFLFKDTCLCAGKHNANMLTYMQCAFMRETLRFMLAFHRPKRGLAGPAFLYVHDSVSNWKNSLVIAVKCMPGTGRMGPS